MILSLFRRTDRFFAIAFSLLAATSLSCQPDRVATPGGEKPPASSASPGGIVIDAATDGRRWAGWGCSLSWWANVFGKRDDIADALFTTRSDIRIQTDGPAVTVPGLGLNVVRYNIGGSGEDTDSANGARPDNPPAFSDFKRIRGFWLNWNDPDPTSRSWDWTRDENQRAMLGKARQRGATVFEAFSTSPMWWMNKNKSVAGGKDGRDNLQTWNQKDFAHYLATVTRVAADRWGIEFQTVAPFNEPSAPWWKYPGGQEGCHFDRAAQSEVVALLRQELDRQGLRQVAIAASEENSVDDALATWTTLRNTARSAIGQVNAHGYYGLDPYRGKGRRPLSEAVRASGKRLSISEYGDSDRTAKSLAVSLLLDLKELRPDSWVYWQPLDGSNWGLIDADAPKGKIGQPTTKWYVMAQFSRHLRPGMSFLPCSQDDCLAAYDAKQSKLVIIFVNTGGERSLTFDLSGFRTMSGSVSLWRTEMTDRKDRDRYKLQTPPERSGATLKVLSPANTVQTLEISGVQAGDSPKS